MNYLKALLNYLKLFHNKSLPSEPEEVPLGVEGLVHFALTDLQSIEVQENFQ